MSPPRSSRPEVAPHSDKSSPDFCGVTVEVHPPSTSDSTDFDANTNTNFSSSSSSNNYISAVINSPRPSSFRAANSVEAVPTIGTLPLGSLRIADDPDIPDTPLTTPDRSRPSTGSSSSRSSRHRAPGRMTPTGRDVFLLDDLPAGFVVGCDAASFGTNKQQPPFQGFRDIPAGAHLVWVSPSESASTRSAYWIVTPKREAWQPADVYVKQWSQYSEILGEPTTQAEERFQRDRLRHIFDVLLPYEQIQPVTKPPRLLAAPPGRAEAEDDGVHKLPSFLADVPSIWSQLTSAIHPELLDRITGKPAQTETPTTGGWQVTTSDRVAGEPMLESEAHLYASGTTYGGGAASPPLRFRFAMDELLIKPSATGEERTRQALDPSDYVIESLEGGDPNPLNPYAHADDLVGELSFAFLTGAHLGNHSLLEQWWFYVKDVVFRSYSLAVRRPRLALALIQAFHAQLIYDDRYLDNGPPSRSTSPSSLILDMFPEHARALQRALVTYKARLDEHLLALGDRISPAQHAVGTAFADLEAWLWRLGWDLRGDYVRAGNLVLEDGEVVQAELSDFEDEDERGEFAPAVVRLDDEGREVGRLLSWGD
ncbi:C2H2 finger domain transcription factor con7 [Hypoxylon texense]